MKKLGRFFFFILTCTALSCCFSENVFAQRRHIEPIVTQPPNGGVSENPENDFQKPSFNLSPKKLFQYALIRYQFGDYAKAESLYAEYKKVSSGEPRSEREIGRLMHAKTLIHLQQTERGIAELNELQLTLRSPDMRQEALFDLAVGKFRKGDHFAAAQHFIEIAGNKWNMQDSSALRNKAVMNLRLLAAAHLSVEEISRLANSAAYLNIRAVLLSVSLQKCLAGDVLPARPPEASGAVVPPQQDDAVKETEDNDDEADDEEKIDWVAMRRDSLLKAELIPAINRLVGTELLDPVCKTWLASGLQQANAFLSGSLKSYRIGVLIPIDLEVFDGSDSQKIGTQILTGTVFRAYEFNRKSTTDHVSLFVRNTYGLDGTHLVNATNALIEQDSVQLIFGPIYSDQARVVSMACAAKGITMITPTATDEHITSGIRTSFQINPTHNMRGRAIAKYLMQFPTMKTFGIFAERNTYGVEMAEGFRQEVLARGGTVKVYSMLSPNFSSLKEAVDTLNIRYQGRLKGYKEQRFDAIYLPLTNLESIGIALSQLRFYNFSGQIVGSGDWNDLVILRRFEDMLNGVIYATDSYIAYDNPQTSLILTGYQLYWQSRHASLFWNGYDTLDYLIHTLVSTGQRDRAKIPETLMTAPPYKTAHTEIFFGGGNINQRMNIMQYQNGLITRIQ